MIIEHEEFGMGEVMVGSERLDESTGILYADVLFGNDVRFDMAIGVMAEGRNYPGGLRKSPNYYANDSAKDKLIKDKFDEIEKNFGKPKQEKKPANEEVEQIDELSKEKLSSYVKAKKAAIPYQAKDKEIEKAEKKIKKMNEDNEPKLSGYTEMSRMKGVESVARSIMSQNRDLRHEALISDFESRSHQANNNKGE